MLEANLTFDGNNLVLTGSLHTTILLNATAIGNKTIVDTNIVIPQDIII